MKLEIAKAMVLQAQNHGIDMNLRENYSGRGMCGKETTAIVYESLGDLLKAVALISSNEDLHDGFILDELCEDLEDIRTDNIGRSMLAY